MYRHWNLWPVHRSRDRNDRQKVCIFLNLSSSINIAEDSVANLPLTNAIYAGTSKINCVKTFMCACCHFSHDGNKKDPFNPNVFDNFESLKQHHQQIILNLLNDRTFKKLSKDRNITSRFANLNWDRRKFTPFF